MSVYECSRMNKYLPFPPSLMHAVPVARYLGAFSASAKANEQGQAKVKSGMGMSCKFEPSLTNVHGRFPLLKSKVGASILNIACNIFNHIHTYLNYLTPNPLFPKFLHTQLAEPRFVPRLPYKACRSGRAVGHAT